MEIHDKLVDLQKSQDDLLSLTLSNNMESMNKIQNHIHTLSESLAHFRRRCKEGQGQLDLSDCEEKLHRLHSLWTAFKEADPYSDASEEARLFPADLDFEKVDVTLIEEMMDKISIMVSSEQNKIPELMQKLKLVTDLNEIISNIIREMAKAYNRSSKTPIENLRA